MGFEIVIVDDLNCPMLLCDACGKRIESDRDGVYLWKVGQGHIYFAHHNTVGESRCHERLEDRFGKRQPWDHLREFFRFLDVNILRTDPLGHRVNKTHTNVNRARTVDL